MLLLLGLLLLCWPVLLLLLLLMVLPLLPLLPLLRTATTWLQATNETTA